MNLFFLFRYLVEPWARLYNDIYLWNFSLCYFEMYQFWILQPDRATQTVLSMQYGPYCMFYTRLYSIEWCIYIWIIMHIHRFTVIFIFCFRFINEFLELNISMKFQLPPQMIFPNKLWLGTTQYRYLVSSWGFLVKAS